MIIALDSNVLVYIAGVVKAPTDNEKTASIRPMVDRLALSETVLCPLQAFGETYHVMLRHGLSREECRSTILIWRRLFEIAPSTETAFMSAIDLATDHKLQFWDALILSVSAEAGCTLLLSEDLQPGFTWRGVTVVNPFAAEIDRRLARLLTE